MKRLIFDVSTHLMYIGYSRRDEINDFSIRIAKRDHAKYLVDRIDQLLKRNRVTIDDVEAIIVGVGPGSYTGIRVAVMVAKMLAYAKDIPLYGVSSLFLLTSGYEERVAAMIDARRGNVFSAVHDGTDILLEDGLRPFAELMNDPVYQSSKAVFIDENNYEIDLQSVLKRATRITDVHGFVPNYLRETEAERKNDEKGVKT
ncbi:MAG: tRNA (adenosine(37)-N6)-threonylcarbamoyltransferase complex dimerization subunit type 1 TsaB [Acholeplasmataceae bacterium]